eukprot:5351864-Prymnesium_polylepis.1
MQGTVCRAELASGDVCGQCGAVRASRLCIVGSLASWASWAVLAQALHAASPVCYSCCFAAAHSALMLGWSLLLLRSDLARTASVGSMLGDGLACSTPQCNASHATARLPTLLARSAWQALSRNRAARLIRPLRAAERSLPTPRCACDGTCARAARGGSSRWRASRPCAGLMLTAANFTFAAWRSIQWAAPEVGFREAVARFEARERDESAKVIQRLVRALKPPPQVTPQEPPSEAPEPLLPPLASPPPLLPPKQAESGAPVLRDANLNAVLADLDARSDGCEAAFGELNDIGARLSLISNLPGATSPHMSLLSVAADTTPAHPLPSVASTAL